mmetsp:Transcript_58195/g.162252  ORF Transcript_58195/g.162252 Transcript_58195/m.162252 type:complete len:476 (-) Transcript_58195:87-1514(-)
MTGRLKTLIRGGPGTDEADMRTKAGPTTETDASAQQEVELADAVVALLLKDYDPLRAAVQDEDAGTFAKSATPGSNSRERSCPVSQCEDVTVQMCPVAYAKEFVGSLVDAGLKVARPGSAQLRERMRPALEEAAVGDTLDNPAFVSSASNAERVDSATSFAAEAASNVPQSVAAPEAAETQALAQVETQVEAQAETQAETQADTQADDVHIRTRHALEAKASQLLLGKVPGPKRGSIASYTEVPPPLVGDSSPACMGRKDSQLLQDLGMLRNEVEREPSTISIKERLYDNLMAKLEDGSLTKAIDSIRPPTPQTAALPSSEPKEPERRGEDNKMHIGISPLQFSLVMQVISQRDRRIGELQCAIRDAERSVLERDRICDKMQAQLCDAQKSLESIAKESALKGLALEKTNRERDDLEANFKSRIASFNAGGLRRLVAADMMGSWCAKSDLSTCTGGTHVSHESPQSTVTTELSGI